MITLKRRRDHNRVNAHLELSKYETPFRSGFSWSNIRGRGKYLKRRLHKAARAYAKALIRGNRGKEPIRQSSEVNWKGH